METINMETFNGTYLKKYHYFAYILSAACVISMTLLGIFAFTKDTWSFGIIVLLALSLVLTILAIISWVALYREEGRYRERRFPKDPQKEFEKEILRLKELAKDLELKNTELAEAKQKIDKENSDLQKKNQQTDSENSDLKADIASLQTKIGELLGKDFGEEWKIVKTQIIIEFVAEIDKIIEGHNNTQNEKLVEWNNAIKEALGKLPKL